MLAISHVDSLSRERLIQNEYFSHDSYSLTHESYLETVEKMNSLSESCITRRSPTPGPSSNESHPVPITMFHGSTFQNSRLLKINLPQFNGSLSEWLSFRDLFTSLILNNAIFSPVEKLQYLQTSLTGSAAHLLKNMPLTSDNFQKSWDALVSFYDNRRILVNSALQSLFANKIMNKESVSELESLYTAVMQNYRTLETLERPIQHWDDIIVFMMVQRLDSESVKAWEMQLGSSKDPPTWTTFYLPHHGVSRASNSTSKIRVVFNGSCTASGGISINDALHVGPKLQVNLLDVLIWMRKFKFVFVCDIEKMYRQIQLHPSDRNFQRILWYENRSVKKYELTTVTYGLSCAPFLALRTVTQLIIDEGTRYPLAMETLTQGRYVDDIFSGGDTIPEAKQIIHHLQGMCTAGGFPLKKWAANNDALLDSISVEDQNTDTTSPIRDNFIPALGLYWSPSLDCFQFRFTLPELKTADYTKRLVLSLIAKFFDPIGFLSPLFIRAKIFMQELWVLQLQWDDPLPAKQLGVWLGILNQIRDVGNIMIPRWIGLTSTSKVELHGFCDASQ